MGNVIPKEWKHFVKLALGENSKEARKSFFALYDICQAMVLEVNPQCVKYAAHLLGKCSSKMRLPLIEPSEENQKKIQMSTLEMGAARL